MNPAIKSYLVKILHTVFFVFLFMEASSQARQDSMRTIEIIRARSLREIQIDSLTDLTMLAGDAVVKQGNTILSGDSIVLNKRTGVAEVFGNVHINDADSVHTYANYLRYLGRERIAFLKKNVRLTDGKGTLITDDLEYNLATGIANYKNGGQVVNGKTVLTSADAVYYSDTKDVYFKKYVHLTDPKYDIIADSLLYNTEFKTATFIAPTRIKSKEGVMNTKSGTYNLETGEAVFYERSSYSDSAYSMTGDKMAFDEKSGVIQIENNGKLVDSVNNVTVLGNQILLDKNKKSFLATRKPVMILYKKNDSTYVAADTLFSGLRKYDTVSKKTVISQDTLTRVTKINTSRDSMVNNKVTADDSTIQIAINNPGSKDSIRYFLAFHNVRIFNDSLQAVSDSLYYSTEDSVFRLFYNPVFWNDKTQVSGDTMYLFTENQKPKRLYVFNNSLVVNKANEGMYNQVGGRTLNGYFREGGLDSIYVKGSPAESIYYTQDDDSAYIGMNRSKGDRINIYFVNKELNKVKFINNVDGTLYPMRQIPADQRYLKFFEWKDKRRPKNKLELFE